MLDRSPLRPEGHQYHLYVANDTWNRRLFFAINPNASGLTYYVGHGGNTFLAGADFDSERLIKRGHSVTPPRTLAYYCGHELTHVITGEHIGPIALLRLPEWAREGIADYVGFENRESFAQLRNALGERPVDVRMIQTYGAYPRYRLLVTYFLEEQGWSVAQLLATKLTLEDALRIMRADAGR